MHFPYPFACLPRMHFVHQLYLLNVMFNPNQTQTAIIRERSFDFIYTMHNKWTYPWYFGKCICTNKTILEKYRLFPSQQILPYKNCPFEKKKITLKRHKIKETSKLNYANI